MPKLKNILIFIAIGAIFVLIYIFFIKPSPSDTPSLVSSQNVGTPLTGGSAVAATDTTNPLDTQGFLNLLLNVKSIKLDDSIFSDPAFLSLHDSSILLVPDGTEGRVNPFAPIGVDATSTIVPTSCTLPKVLDTSTNTCVTPVPVATCTLPKVLDASTNTCVTPASH